MRRTLRTMLPALAVVAAFFVPAVSGAGKWEVRFFYDQGEAQLTIVDLAFPSPSRGVALGYLTLHGGKPQPRAVITSDGGDNWTLVKLKETGRSLFFLDDSIGWMVTAKGVWQTVESGLTWRKISKKRGILRVCFLDEGHGFAVGEKKAIYETRDGGRHWTPLPVADEPKTTKDYTTYSWIEFGNHRQGTIIGSSDPPQRSRSRYPEWMEPDRVVRQRQWPSLSIVTQTGDGGKSWKPATTSIFGHITRVRMAHDGRSLLLIRFQNSFEWPCEVYVADPRTGKIDRVFRRKDRSITDVAWTNDGTAYLAGYEPTGKLLDNPIPGRLVVLRSKDLTNWEEMEVDYRGSAHFAMLAAPGASDVWLATDIGMILKLAEE